MLTLEKLLRNPQYSLGQGGPGGGGPSQGNMGNNNNNGNGSKDNDNGLIGDVLGAIGDGWKGLGDALGIDTSISGKDSTGHWGYGRNSRYGQEQQSAMSDAFNASLGYRAPQEKVRQIGLISQHAAKRKQVKSGLAARQAAVDAAAAKINAKDKGANSLPGQQAAPTNSQTFGVNTLSADQEPTLSATQSSDFSQFATTAIDDALERSKRDNKRTTPFSLAPTKQKTAAQIAYETYTPPAKKESKSAMESVAPNFYDYLTENKEKSIGGLLVAGAKDYGNILTGLVSPQAQAKGLDLYLTSGDPEDKPGTRESDGDKYGSAAHKALIAAEAIQSGYYTGFGFGTEREFGGNELGSSIGTGTGKGTGTGTGTGKQTGKQTSTGTTWGYTPGESFRQAESEGRYATGFGTGTPRGLKSAGSDGSTRGGANEEAKKPAKPIIPEVAPVNDITGEVIGLPADARVSEELSGFGNTARFGKAQTGQKSVDEKGWLLGALDDVAEAHTRSSFGTVAATIGGSLLGPPGAILGYLGGDYVGKALHDREGGAPGHLTGETRGEGGDILPIPEPGNPGDVGPVANTGVENARKRAIQQHLARRGKAVRGTGPGNPTRIGTARTGYKPLPGGVGTTSPNIGAGTRIF